MFFFRLACTPGTEHYLFKASTETLFCSRTSKHEPLVRLMRSHPFGSVQHLSNHHRNDYESTSPNTPPHATRSILHIVRVWIIWQLFCIPDFKTRPDIPAERSGVRRSSMSRLNKELKWCVCVLRDRQSGRDRRRKNEIHNAVKLIADTFLVQLCFTTWPLKWREQTSARLSNSLW